MFLFVWILFARQDSSTRRPGTRDLQYFHSASPGDVPPVPIHWRPLCLLCMCGPGLTYRRTVPIPEVFKLGWDEHTKWMNGRCGCIWGLLISVQLTKVACFVCLKGIPGTFPQENHWVMGHKEGWVPLGGLLVVPWLQHLACWPDCALLCVCWATVLKPLGRQGLGSIAGLMTMLHAMAHKMGSSPHSNAGSPDMGCRTGPLVRLHTTVSWVVALVVWSPSFFVLVHCQNSPIVG